MKHLHGVKAFTLIELSIVLVIIGLIVGGILVGQDLIKGAAVRATITQIERYNTAVHDFQQKYGGLPGDLNATLASQFGFSPRGSYAGQGDGNGLIEGVASATGNNWGVYQTAGETALFWVDLSQVGLIDARFYYGSATTIRFGITNSTTPSISYFLPQAKIGQGNYILVEGFSGINYFALGGITELDYGATNSIVETPSLTTSQAYNIDKKIDDGLPQSGSVTANLQTYNSNWIGVDPGNAAAPSPTTCYDDGGNTSNTMQYSTEVSGGNNLNCALSFRFQ